MSQTLIIDRSPGEIRAGLFDENNLAQALFVERASEHLRRAHTGALYCGRVTALDHALNAAFVDIGIGPPGFLPLGKSRGKTNIHEGSALAVRVRREAFTEKGPLLVLDNAEKDFPTQHCPALLTPAPDFVQRITPKDAKVREASREGRELLDTAFEEVLNPLVLLPGGGELMIEPTRALVAVDVDTAADKSRALAVNLEAISVIFNHLALRGLAGIVAIDFAPMKGAKERKKLNTTLMQAVTARHSRMEAEPLNRFGVAVLTLQRRQRPLAETMLDKNGVASSETTALNSLRRVENEHRANPAKGITLEAAPSVIDWLETCREYWAEPLLSRLGGRLSLIANPDLSKNKFEVIAK